MSHIDNWLARLADIKEQESVLADERKSVEGKIMDFLASNDSDHIESADGSIKATVVHSTALKIDEDALADEMSPHMWRQITKRVLDTKALEDKVARGVIDVDVVSKHSTEVPRKPYLRMTERKQ